jgi:hypothetical protein
MSNVSPNEIELIEDFIRRFRASLCGSLQPISSATVALGLPALHAVERIEMVLAEMEKRGLLEIVPDPTGIGPLYQEVRK